MLRSYNKTFVAVLTLLGIVVSLGFLDIVKAGGSGALCTLQSCTVAIKIRPDEPGIPSINPRSRGVLSVAVFSSGNFDATTIDTTKVLFGPDALDQQPKGAAPVRVLVQDVDHDGYPDLVFYFRIQDTVIQCGDTSADLVGQFFPKGGLRSESFVGTDTFRTVGCH
jgi:hypothetical protein